MIWFEAVKSAALGLDAWPKSISRAPLTTRLADAGWYWEESPCGLRMAHAMMKNRITKQDWLDKRRQLGLTDPLVTGKPEEWPEDRIDAIGQNGHHPDVYEQAADSPIGTGLKYDGDKVRMDLLTDGMPRALEAVGEILTFGAQKYKAHSWKTVEGNTERYNAAKVRHMIARAKGEERDPESGMLHLAHEACNALFLLELALLDAEDEGVKS